MLQVSQLITKKKTLTIAALVGFGAALGAEALEAPCPENLYEAERLILVVASDMDSRAATVQLIERPSREAAWSRVGEPMKSVVGYNGIGWAWPFAALAKDKEPSKREGDGRTPAGFFSVGQPFGFAAGTSADYVRLEKGRSFCVNDLRSPHYNTIMTKADAGAGTSGEDMALSSLYRRGIFVDYPTDRERKGGSCIFIHVWRSPESGTAGCVALDELDVRALQQWVGRKPTLLGIVPRAALSRMQACLPGL
jgi:D-alanyl-D-alanine dipeptidase